MKFDKNSKPIFVEDGFYKTLESKKNKEEIVKKMNDFLINRKDDEFLSVDILYDGSDETCFIILDANGMVKSVEYF